MTRFKPVVSVVSVLSLLALSGFSAEATTAVSGALNAVANSTIDHTTITDTDHSSWSGAPTPLSTSVSATVTHGDDFVMSSGAAVATWASADAGTVSFSNYGWHLSINDPGFHIYSSDFEAGRGGDDWSYTFTASQTGKIELNYSSSLVSGDPFGLQGWSIDWTGVGFGYPVLDPLDPTQSGVFTGILVAGETYTIGLNGSANISTFFPKGDRSAYMDGSFSWGIVANVPEPSTWAMMLLGFAGLGFAGYRRAAGCRSKTRKHESTLSRRSASGRSGNSASAAC